MNGILKEKLMSLRHNMFETFNFLFGKMELLLHFMDKSMEDIIRISTLEEEFLTTI